jgi:hypothetical protein
MDPEFEQTYLELRALMLRAAGAMTVSEDTDGRLEIVAPWSHPRRPSGPMWFGAVRLGKAYVSFHLMPLYTSPALAARIVQALRRRMQGKSCFNFKILTPEIVRDLEALTLECAEAWARAPTDMA